MAQDFVAPALARQLLLVVVEDEAVGRHDALEAAGLDLLEHHTVHSQARRQLDKRRGLRQVQSHQRHVDLDLGSRTAPCVPNLAEAPDLRKQRLEIRPSPDPEMGRCGRGVQRERDPAQPFLDEAVADGLRQQMTVRVETSVDTRRVQSLQEVPKVRIEKRLARPVQADAPRLAEKRQKTAPRLRIHVAAQGSRICARVAAHHARGASIGTKAARYPRRASPRSAADASRTGWLRKRRIRPVRVVGSRKTPHCRRMVARS